MWWLPLTRAQPKSKLLEQTLQIVESNDALSGQDGLYGSFRTTSVSVDAATPHSHSIVPGGLLVTSYTTRLTPFTSLMMRVATWPMNFISKG